MKKNILYVLLGGLLLSLAACSENWEDATSKHVYGENENPYLRADAEATVTKKIQFGAGQTQIINLSDYAELFQVKLGMTLDEAIAGISLEWRELPRRKASRIVIERPANFSDSALWPEQFDWLMNTTLKLKSAFTPYL